MELSDVVDILKEAGWKLVRHRKHEVWYCPDGEHQATVPITPSDFRTPLNLIRDLRAKKCPSLAGLDRDPRVIESYPPCHCCGKTWPADRLDKQFFVHGDIMACSGHKGIREWHEAELKKEKALAEQAG